MIVLMAGLPASGKSTLCRELAARVSGIVLDKDILRSALFAPAEIEYSTEQDDFCMTLLLQAAAYVLGKNRQRIVFLDGRPFARAYQIDQVLRFALEVKQEWRILECVCSDETARRRLQTASEHPAANRDFDLYLRMKVHFEEIGLPKTIIDTDQALEVCVRLGLAAIKSESF